MSPAVEEAIKSAVGDEYFVNVTTVVLTNIDFSDAFELAVEEKMIAEQAKLKAEYENETKIAQAKAEAEAKLKEAQAEIEIAQAKADAELKKAQAQIEIEKANAEAIKIQAEAEAEANKIITESITQDLIDKILADNWNGELPNVVGDGEVILPSDIFN
jgi:regulator of protease activity HflC (stomatin/prohibitin superfamily)